ncbi:Uncharacterized protein ChrSV_0471 [Chromobacterium vaccinii]|nr:Uncharacterized protein ChrSW_0471 [Chromobacterium vaccinii]QND87930.1 Uncharacterized protein ChrSV_0471 [Chromobacterium vaccinii]
MSIFSPLIIPFVYQTIDQVVADEPREPEAAPVIGAQPPHLSCAFRPLAVLRVAMQTR